MDIEHELRAMDQARLTTDGIHFDNIEGQAWLNRVVTNYRQQSSSEPGQRTDVQDRLGEAPMRRTINPRRRIGPVNPRGETASTSRSDTRSETKRTLREERRPNRSSLM